MSVDPDLRVALGFILLLRIGVGLLYSKKLSEIGFFSELRRLPGASLRQWIVLACLTFPLILFVIDADGMAWALMEVNFNAAEYSIMYLPDLFRWLMLVPAVAGLLLAIGSWHCAVCPAEMNADDPPENRFISGPFRYVRFPQASADLLLCGPLAVATDNWSAVVLFFGAFALLRGVLLRDGEEAWRRLLGDGYGAYADRTGALLPPMPHGQFAAAPQYSVPKRFGLSAIIALVTMFAVIFGAINLLQAEVSEIPFAPVLHLFFGVELLAIWVCQMRFGQAPRGVSTLVGAVLLPLFVYMSIDTPPVPPGWRTLFTLVLVFFGGLVGYCLGALAAGLFLVMDWVAPYLPGSRHSPFKAGAASTTSPWANDEPRDAQAPEVESGLTKGSVRDPTT